MKIFFIINKFSAKKISILPQRSFFCPTPVIQGGRKSGLTGLPPNDNLRGIGAVRQDGQRDIDYRVAILGREDYRLGAVTFVHHDGTILLLEAHYLVARQGVTLVAQHKGELLGRYTVLGQRHVHRTSCLIGTYMLQPMCLGPRHVVDAHLHSVASFQDREDAAQLTVDAGIQK